MLEKVGRILSFIGAWLKSIIVLVAAWGFLSMLYESINRNPDAIMGVFVIILTVSLIYACMKNSTL